MNNDESMTEQAWLTDIQRADSQTDEPEELIAQMRQMLHRVTDYIPLDERARFEEDVQGYMRVLDKLGEVYRADIFSHPLHLIQARGRLFAALWQNADVWSKRLRQASAIGWNEIKDNWRTFRNTCERKERQCSFAETDDPAEFKTQLLWMRGTRAHDAENLSLVRQARKTPRFRSAELEQQMALAEKTIIDYLYAPEAVSEREERAYQQHRATWDSEYRGQQIAIHLGEVIAAHPERAGLVDLLRQLQQEHGALRAYVVQIGGPVLDCTDRNQPLVDDSKP